MNYIYSHNDKIINFVTCSHLFHYIIREKLNVIDIINNKKQTLILL